VRISIWQSQRAIIKREMIAITDIINYIQNGLHWVVTYWWAWLPVLLGIAAYETWFEYQRAAYIAKIKWILLEVIPPPEIPYSSPKAADSIFAGLHSSYAGFPGTGWKSQFFQGKVPVWFSLEIVSNGGETHFYIRCPEDQRNMVESLVFSQYPQAEVRVMPDYIDLVPAPLDLARYDVSGAELEFTKDAPYPIKTFIEFEEAGGKDEYARLDPLAPLMESMSALRPGEHLWVQYVIRATGGDWVKAGEKLVDKLKGKKDEPPKPALQWLFGPIEMVLETTGLIPVPEPKKEDKKEFNLQNLSPAQKKVLEQVEYKLAKLGFKVGIRVFYAASKEAFNGSRIAGVTAMFKQLYYNNLNSFKPGNMTRDKGFLKWLFPNDVGFGAAPRIVKKKKTMFEAYRNRAFPEKDGKEMLVILNTEELATLWHLPGLNVKAPMLPRVQSKKGQPPAILPTR
jgi:hypothetical protein